MSVVFMDGFDYGLPAAPKWDSVSLSNTYTAGGGRRTGTGALDLESTGDNVVTTLTAATTELSVARWINCCRTGWRRTVRTRYWPACPGRATSWWPPPWQTVSRPSPYLRRSGRVRRTSASITCRLPRWSRGRQTAMLPANRR